MTTQEVREGVQKAIFGVQAEVPLLDFKAVHERSTAHRLAVHLESVFRGWNVDCEYDRDGQIRKYLLGKAQCDSQSQSDAIVPDIIVHHRRGLGREHNLLVIEMKKNAAEDACDQSKLKLLTAQTGRYQYQLGLYINVDGGKFTCTWYKNGEKLK